MRKYLKNFNFFSIITTLFLLNFSSFGNTVFSQYKELRDFKGKVLEYGEYEKREGINYNKKTGERFTGRTYGFYENGRLKGTAEYINGIKTGIQYDYYSNGQLKNEAKFKNGKLNGGYIGYHANGKLFSKREYKDDIMIEYLSYLKDGKTLTFFYKNKEMIGYYKDGTIRSKLPCYIEDYEENGIDKFRCIYDGVGKFYNKKGILEGEVQYKENSTYGNELRAYYPNGEVQLYAIMGNKMTEFQDTVIEYYDNGQAKQECSEETGRWICKKYSKNGEYKGADYGKPKTYSSLWINSLLGVLNVLF